MQIRRATPDDADACARAMFDAFEKLATDHAFPIEPESREFTDFQLKALLTTDGIYALVAERDGEILGSAFQDERGKIVGVGPVSVDPAVQDGGVGRTLMEALLQRSRERAVAGVRLVQTAYHYRSLSLYAKLGSRSGRRCRCLTGRRTESYRARACARRHRATSTPAMPFPCGTRPRPT